MFNLKTIYLYSPTAGVDYGQFAESGIGLNNIMFDGESSVESGIVIFDDSVAEFDKTFTIG